MYSLMRYIKVCNAVRFYVCCPVNSNAISPVKWKLKCCEFSIYTRTCNKTGSTSRSLLPKSFFDAENKDKETYLAMIDIFKGRDIYRTGHVEFVYAALRHMEEFGVDKDLEAYKSLIDVLPKGRFIPQNIIQAEFIHYPKQQQCIIEVLEQMENKGVMPDRDLESILLNIFGRRGYPLRKYWRMMYWMPRFKNLSPWPLPNPVPNDSFELAMLAIRRITDVDPQTQISVYQAEELRDALDKTWIVSGQSPVQKDLLAKHPDNIPVYVEGAFTLWLRNAHVYYFILRTDYKFKHREEVDDDDVSIIENPYDTQVIPAVEEELPEPTVHEQEDGTILAVCATGSSSRDSLLSWIRHLEKDNNPSLQSKPVLFTLKSPLGAVAIVEDEPKKITDTTE